MANRKPKTKAPRPDTKNEESANVANRPSNPNQLPNPEESGGQGRKLENPILPVDE